MVDIIDEIFGKISKELNANRKGSDTSGMQKERQEKEEVRTK